MGVAAEFIKIDAEIHRLRQQLKSKKGDPSLTKQISALMKSRDKLFLEMERKARASIANENFKRLNP